MAVSESPQPDHYATLGLSPDATGMDVENAFHTRVREHLQHSNVADKPIRERARQVGLAYETLRDPAKRRAYDEARAAAASADPAAPSEGVRRVPPPLVMFTPPQMPDRPADEVPVARSEPTPVPAQPGPEPEPVGAYTPVESVDEPRVPPPVAVPVPIEPVAVQPIADPESEYVAPGEPVADEQAEPTEATSSWHPAASSVVPLTFVDEPRAEEAAVVPWDGNRRSGMHRGVLAAAALVIALGVGGLLLTRVGSPSPKAPVQAVLPVAVEPGQPIAGSPQAAPVVPPTGGAPVAATPHIGQRSAVGTQVPIAASPDRLATIRIPTDATTAAPATSAPAATIQVKLPPPTPSSTAPDASTAAAAAIAAAPPPAVTPPPPPPAAPAQQARSVQPFPRWLGGGLMNSDNPGGRYQGTVGVHFTVGANGRVSDCRPVASSGNPGLDSNTCSLVEQRLRFSPALNAQGQPIATDVRTSYTWGRTTRRR